MNRLWVRLSLAFLSVAWLSIAVIAVVVNATTGRTFRQYLNRRDSSFFDAESVARLETFYAENGSWAGVDALLPGPKGSGSEHGTGQGRGRAGGAQALIVDASGVVVAATDPAQIGTRPDSAALDGGVALYVGGEQVGWLVPQTPGAQALGEAEQFFLDQTTRALALAAIGAALCATLAGGALSWQLSRPVRTLTRATNSLAGGQLGQQVPLHGPDELVALAEAFNRMSRDLAEGESLRRRMAADIAHELRTPVSVLRGHLEAMLDGVYPLNTEHLAVAYDRTLHLARLVDDLRLLTRAEAGQLPLQKVRVAPAELVTRLLDSFAPLALDAGLTLTRDIAPNLPDLLVDADRLQQVLSNLLTNALRHTDPGGHIAVSVNRTGGAVRVAVTNSGTPLSPEEAAQVFTPFWRAEEARARDRTGSGLGLAISQQLVALHGGRLWVETGAESTTFVFTIPIVDQDDASSSR
ncbi:MAG: ATP-binding protein [Anaerolineae bacterium]